MQLSCIDFVDIKHNFVWSNAEIILIWKNMQMVGDRSGVRELGSQKIKKKIEVLGPWAVLKSNGF